jgi:hypothetical protein
MTARKKHQNHIDAIRSVTQWPIIRQLLRQYIRLLFEDEPVDWSQTEAIMEEVLE